MFKLHFIFLFSTVDVRARKLQTDPKFVLKEMLIRVDDQLTLLITNGNSTIDLEALGKELNKKVEIPKAGDLKVTFFFPLFPLFSLFPLFFFFLAPSFSLCPPKILAFFFHQ